MVKIYAKLLSNQQRYDIIKSYDNKWPESFYNQITARLSVEGAKVWTTSNPSNPQHWFYKNVICKLEDMNGLYVHFTMDDNPSLSDDVKERYKSMYSGVWAKRFIEGLVTLALVKYV